MLFIIKEHFEKQLKNLSKKYKLILDDFENFQLNFNILEGKHLGKGIYKFRMKNSSIPVGKSGGFRIILFLKVEENKVMPFIIYSKTDIEAININDIISELEKYI
ncbi:MAG: addiction module toxin RelE [Candidatus Gracilibacteria bacterium]|nr:addiction module toxin RelE [Candidatus Gracilibacteria bacterium]